MGAVALGVLVGYPFGGIVYDLWGKDAVFIAILVMIMPVVVVVMISAYNDHEDYEKLEESDHGASVRGITEMLTEPVVIIATGATLLSSASIAILEPTLPIWLIDTFNPPRWQIGTVFLPDSIGYFVGTHFFTHVTRHLSR
ncbi:chromaffin granule amine transporter-like [Galendromus occidentalis]|uniref:Chromaffin granule amine transporter-like n=1 Tax=Galendromus occidentalis TaxID=34638 RepID=A0AAJ7WHB9_9ACAR|nr:chromaffin granule amine transporter-like [Galendromus occidentalis]